MAVGLAVDEPDGGLLGDLGSSVVGDEAEAVLALALGLGDGEVLDLRREGLLDLFVLALAELVEDGGLAAARLARLLVGPGGGLGGLVFSLERARAEHPSRSDVESPVSCPGPHVDFANATKSANRYIGTILRVEALANLLPRRFEAMRYRFACCLASEERLGGCADRVASSGEDPASAAALRRGDIDARLLAALEAAGPVPYAKGGVNGKDGTRVVDAGRGAVSQYATGAGNGCDVGQRQRLLSRSFSARFG